MEQTGCSETSAYKIQTPGNYPEENIQHLYIIFSNFSCPAPSNGRKIVVFVTGFPI